MAVITLTGRASDPDRFADFSGFLAAGFDFTEALYFAFAAAFFARGFFFAFAIAPSCPRVRGDGLHEHVVPAHQLAIRDIRNSVECRTVRAIAF